MSDRELSGFSPVDVVGDWALDKHSTLCKYTHICQAVRRKFTLSGATYIDLYCGAGKARIRDSGQIVDGSPMVAAKKARSTRSDFRTIYIADADATKLEACSARLSDEGFKVEAFHGRSEDTVHEVLERLHPAAFHFAFLDPFSIDLPFSVIEALAQLRCIDIMLLISDMDLIRNVENEHIDAKRARLDRFAPGWRSALDLHQPKRNLARAVLEYWRTQVDCLGLKRPAEIRPIKAGKHSHIYHLALLSQNEKLSNRFWKAVLASETKQIGLF